MKFSKLLLATMALPLAFVSPVWADDDDDDDADGGEKVELIEVDYGFAGLLAKNNRIELEPISLSSGQPLSDEPWQLRSGRYYSVDITSDGSAEIALTGPEFFRAIWVNEVVVNDLETRPMGLSSFEFDDAGTIALKFIAILPGQYELYVPGARGDTQKLQITIQ